MIFRETYQRLGANNLDVNTLLHRYKLAKYLVAVSLLVVIVMALGPFLSEGTIEIGDVGCGLDMEFI